jgi:hypothetical protein
MATKNNQFVVDLGDLPLPPATARQLKADIKKLVLSTLAGLDLKGDLQVSSTLPKDFGGRTDGIVADVVLPQL